MGMRRNCFQGVLLVGAVLIAASTASAQYFQSGVQSISYSFTSTTIPAQSYIWFTSVIRPDSTISSPVTVSFFNSTISYKMGSQTYTVAVPNGQVTFNPSATASSTYFTNVPSPKGTWVTTVPNVSTSGNTFLTGLAYYLSTAVPGGIGPVMWSGQFQADKSGFQLDWQWGAAVYKPFTTNYSSIQVNPHDGTDPAGTPENYKGNLKGGATNGTTNLSYTGALSQTVDVTCSTPVASPYAVPIVH